MNSLKERSDAITADFLKANDWESRYKILIAMGKVLPDLPENLKTEEAKVKGCQSQVWIIHHHDAASNTLCFEVDSDAFIVKGLLAMVMAAYNGKSPADILAFDIESYFAKTGLIRHLSPTRGNGLKSMVAKIQSIARQHGG